MTTLTSSMNAPHSGVIVPDATRVGADSAMTPWATHVAADVGELAMAPEIAGRNSGRVWFQGISTQASLRLALHLCIEMEVLPGTTYSTMTLPCPEPDVMASEMYRMIALRMMDCYPAAFNDWAKLKAKIGEIARKVLPALRMVAPAALSIIPGGQMFSRPVQGLIDAGITALGPSQTKPRAAPARPPNMAIGRSALRMVGRKK